MSTSIGPWIRRTAIGASLTALALVVGLLASSATALAAPDPLASGSVTLQLRSSGGLKLKPATLSLGIKSGELDPTTGAGTVETSGGFRVKRGGRKAKVKVTRIVFGANGAPGAIDAKVGKRKANGFGKLSGGTLTREGWGAKVEGATVTLGSKGAKALRQALTPRRGGKASAAAGGIKAGKPLGTVSVSGQPKTVEVLPGGTLVFEADTGFVLNKLPAHCIDPVTPPPVVSTPGVAPIPPAVQNLTVFTFPVTGGSIAPDFTAGRVTSAGGQKITKNNGPLTILFDCDQGPPVGTTVTQTEFEDQFELQTLASFTVLPTGPIGIGALGTFDLAAAGTSADVNTKKVTVTDAPVSLDPLSALVLNSVFPNASGDSSNDFSGGDLLGTMSLNVTTH
jgi:hypothetical protein